MPTNNKNYSKTNQKRKILLLENIHQEAIKLFEAQKYEITSLTSSLNEDELCKAIKDVHILGIRSKTTITKKVLQSANKLKAIGAFCIGTNQIDLQEASNKGVFVFNAPFSNTRSVVEISIANMISMLRNTYKFNSLMHQGKWLKSAEGSYEIRGKKIGIIGYGNIGSQLSVLCEALGMSVYYFDKEEKLQLGNAIKCDSLEELLGKVDVVSLHVDGAKSNTNFFGKKEFDMMKPNSIFMNLSRGHIVDIDALKEALVSKKLAYACVDVFPQEPKNNEEPFKSPLIGVDNVILTPHIAGSTIEAQANIGKFVATALINYLTTGSSTLNVNLPDITLSKLQNAHRIIHLHTNKPGILASINALLTSHNVNLLAQYLKTSGNFGYVISDIDVDYDKSLIDELRALPDTIMMRALY